MLRKRNAGEIRTLRLRRRAIPGWAIEQPNLKRVTRFSENNILNQVNLLLLSRNSSLSPVRLEIQIRLQLVI